MVTYAILGSYTEQGIRNIKQLPQLVRTTTLRAFSAQEAEAITKRLP